MPKNATGQHSRSGRSVSLAPLLANYAPRGAAGLTLACLLVHGVLVAFGGAALLHTSLPMLVLMLLLLSALCAVCALRTWHYGASSLDLVLMIVAGSAMAAVHFLIRHQHSGHAMHSMHESSPWGDLNGLLMHAGVTLAVAQAGLAVLAVAARRWMRTESAGSAAGPRIGPVRATLSAAGEGPRIRSGNTEGEAA